MTLQRQTVLYAADASFWDHTFVSIYSLLVNNPDTPFDIHVISHEQNERFIRHIPWLQDAHGNATISVLPVDSSLVKGAPLTFSYITRATYYRLALDQLLPDSIQRALYLDGDTIVRKPLDELFALDVSEHVLAATPEYVSVRDQPRFVPHAPRMGWPPHTPYFNAGMLLINIDRWRSERISKLCFQYLGNHQQDDQKLAFQDQDILNAVLVGRWLRVGPSFNFEPWSIDAQRFADPGPRPVIGFQIDDEGPAIAHFTGTRKPWHGGCPIDYASEYWHYRMQTPYADRRAYARSCAADAWFKAVRPRVAKVLRRTTIGNTLLRKARSRFPVT